MPASGEEDGAMQINWPNRAPCDLYLGTRWPLEAMTCSHRVRGSFVRETITSEASEAHGGLTSAGPVRDLHASSTGKAITSEAFQVHGGLASVGPPCVLHKKSHHF